MIWTFLREYTTSSGLGQRWRNSSDDSPERGDESDFRVRNPLRHPTNGLLEPFAVHPPSAQCLITLESELPFQPLQLRPGRVAVDGLQAGGERALDVRKCCIEGHFQIFALQILLSGTKRWKTAVSK